MLDVSLEHVLCKLITPTIGGQEEHVAVQVFRNLKEAREWLHLMGHQETGQS